jgi:hypothetical protein
MSVTKMLANSETGTMYKWLIETLNHGLARECRNETSIEL